MASAGKVTTFVSLLGAQKKLKLATLIDFQSKETDRRWVGPPDFKAADVGAVQVRLPSKGLPVSTLAQLAAHARGPRAA